MFIGRKQELQFLEERYNRLQGQATYVLLMQGSVRPVAAAQFL